jgi:hypothetical protein
MAITVIIAPSMLLLSSYFKPDPRLADLTEGFWMFGMIALIMGSFQILTSVLNRHRTPILVKALPLVLPTEILASAIPLAFAVR